MNFLPDEDYYSVANRAALGNFDPTWDNYAMSPERKAGMSYVDYMKGLENARLNAADNQYRLIQLERQQADPSLTQVGPDMPPPAPPAPNQVMKPSVNDQVAAAYNRMTTPRQAAPQGEPQYQWTDILPSNPSPSQQMLDQWGIDTTPRDKALGSMSGYPKHIVEKW